MKNHFKGACDILNIEEVTGIAPISMQSYGTTAKKLVGELGNQLFGELMRSIDIVSAGDDTGELERAVVGFDKEFCPGFSGGVGVGGFEDVLFLHCLGFEGFALSVDLVGGDVDEPAHAGVALGRFEEDVRSENVTLGEVEGVAEGVVHVSLSGEVHDGVDVFFVQDVGDEVGAGNVALDEFEVFQTRDFVKVGEAGAVIEFVVDYNVVLGVLFGEKDGDV